MADRQRKGRIQTFGRLHGHRLRERQARLLSELLPKLKVSLEVPGQIEPSALFDPPARPVWLEIGFGSGEHLVWQAERNRDVGFIGAEPFVNGVAKLLAAIDDGHLANIRILDADVRDLLERLAPASVARAFILFPDPWPKTRHHKRRLVNRQTLDALARVLKAGAQLRIASDIADYQRWILSHLLEHPAFEWSASRAEDWRKRPPDWPPTRYEKKALAAGRHPAYLTFTRNSTGQAVD